MPPSYHAGAQASPHGGRPARRPRRELGLLQRDVAPQLGVSEFTPERGDEEEAASRPIAAHLSSSVGGSARHLGSLQSIDRMNWNVYVCQLHREGGVATFFREHRGYPFASSALM